MVALELDVLALKLNRFGWERGRGTPTQDRLILDWMDALQDFPLNEIRAAIKVCIMEQPDKMPNEGHVAGKIMQARARFVAKNRPMVEAPPERERVTKEAAAEIMAKAGFATKGFGHD